MILGIDTSSTDLSVSLRDGDTVVSSVNRYIRNSHAEHITHAVKHALDLGGVTADGVTHIAVSVGPGSFTGLRIGLSFVKGFCLMAERRILPLSSLHILAHAVAWRMLGGDHTPQKIFTALDARQDRIHWASFILDGGLKRLSDDRLSHPGDLLNELSAKDILIIDTMGYSRSTVFNIFKDRAQIIDAARQALNRGDSCAALAADGSLSGELWKHADEIVPNYLQMSAAQEKLCS